MLQHTTLDDFLRGLYVKAVDGGQSKGTVSQHDKLLAQLMDTRDTNREDDSTATGRKGPQLMFDDTIPGAAPGLDKSIDMFRGENLKKIALQNLRDRKQRQKQSEIFNQQESQKRKDDEVEAEEESKETSSLERIDLTKTQLASEQEGTGDSSQLDEFDLLDARIDPKDIRTMEKVNKL